MNQKKQNQGQHGPNKGEHQTEATEDPRENQPNRGSDFERDVADDSGEQGISNRPQMDPDLPDTGGTSQGHNPDGDRSVNQRPGQRRDN